MKLSRTWAAVLAGLSCGIPACQPDHGHDEHAHHEHNKLVATTPKVQDVVITDPYVCQIRSQKNVEIRALEEGYLEAVKIKEGQAVKQDDVLFRVVPILYKTRLDAELAEVRLAELELANTVRLNKTNVVSAQEVALFEAKLARARAKAAQAQAELNFTVVKAPFDGIISRLKQQQGSLVKKEEVLTMLYDNSTMWAYFNVPEKPYLGYMGGSTHKKPGARLEFADSKIELVLADGRSFGENPDNSVTVEGEFNPDTGNIQLRTDFPNPDGLLRQGQTGTIRIHRTVRNATVIPQRATFEILDKRYVYVVGDDHVVRQRPITIRHELEDTFVLAGGVGVNDKILLEGVRQVHDGEKIECELRKADDALGHQKYHAE